MTPEQLHDYFFAEMEPAGRLEFERKLAESSDLRAELGRLELTAAALRSVPDEEPPRRIAFVSDKVFAPSPASRFLGWLAGAAPAMAVSAAIAALTVFLVMPRSPAVVTRTVAVQRPADPQEIQEAVRKAVSAAIAEQKRETQTLLAAEQRKNELERKQLLLNVQDTFTYMQKKMNVTQVASNGYEAVR